jgi:hypothetical protein
MSKAVELIEGLEAQAQLDSAGAFSLDREKARQKMRQFQLADPHRYVLLLVEFATLRGAKRIEFEIDADDMRMRCDAVLEFEDLDELYTSLFVDRSGEGIRARRELALACNAVMALNPKFVEITSFGPKGGVQALLRPDAPDEIRAIEAAQPSGTLVHVKERFRPGLLVRFLRDSQDALPEELLLRERCRYATQEIALDGRTLGAGLPTHLVAAQAFADAELRGVGGIDPERMSDSGIVLLSNGVEIATHELRDSVPGLWFWVDGRALRKDVSQNDIARGDAGYGAMLSRIAGVRDQILGALADAWQHGKFSEHTKPSADEVFKLLSRCFMRWATQEWLRPDAGPLGLLAELPLWRTSENAWLDSRLVLAKADPERGVLYSTNAFEGVVPHGWPPILHPWSGDEEIAAIRRVFVQVDDATSELGRKVPAELARRAWRARPHEPRLPQGSWPKIMPFSQGPHRGEVSLRPGRRTNLRVVVEGCLLHEVEFEGPLVGLVAVLEGPYEPLADYSRAKLDATFAEGLLLVLRQVPPLVDAWLELLGADPGDHLRGVVLSLADASLPGRWLEAFGFKGSAAMLAALGVPQLLPRFGLDTQPTTLAKLLRFDALSGRRVSLVDIHRERATRDYQRGKVLVVQPDAPAIEGLELLLVRTKPEERRLLDAVFGADEVVDETTTIAKQRARLEFLAKPTQAPARPQPTSHVIELERDEQGIHGFVGIDAAELRKPETGRRMAKVELIVEDRRVGVIEVACLLQGVSASLVWPGATLDETCTKVTSSFAPLIAALHRGLALLISEQVERCASLGSRPAGDTRRLLWLAIRGPFLGPEMFAAWRWHRARAEATSPPDASHPDASHPDVAPPDASHPNLDAAIAGYAEIVELFPTYELDAIHESLALLREDRRAPSASALVELLGEPKRHHVASPARGFWRDMLALVPRLEQLPFFATAANHSTSLARLLASFDAKGQIAWLQDPQLTTRDDSELIVRLDTEDQAALVRLLGEGVLVESSLRVREQQQRAAFTDQQPRARIELPALEWLAVVELSVDGFAGELGIPPWPPSQVPAMTVELCHMRRRIEQLEMHAVVPAFAVIDDAHAEFETPFVKVARASARMAALRKHVDEALQGRLLPRLAANFDDLSPERRAIAWDWITFFLVRTAEGAGDHPNRLGELGRRFAALPGFVDVDGHARSLDELITRYQQAGTLHTLAKPAREPLPDPVLLVRPHDEPVLARLFASINDYARVHDEHLQGLARRNQARAVSLAMVPAADSVLARVVLDRHGLAGALWLPAQFPFEARVELAVEGRVIAPQQPAQLLPLASLPIHGLVLGGWACDRAFTKVTASPEQARYLHERAIACYAELAAHYRDELVHLERVDPRDVEGKRRRACRIDTLRRAAIALAKEQARVGQLPPDTSALLDQLASLPLLELASGRLISITVGREARPLELIHLGLWEAPDPGSERFEAGLLGALAEAEAQVKSKAQAQEPTPAGPDSPATPSEPSMPTPTPTPTPPSPPPPDPVGELLEAIREELRLVRKGHETLLAEGLLDELRAEPGRGRGPLVRIDGAVVFDSEHPCFTLALREPDEPVWVSFLASHAFTALNYWQEQVTDADERNFHSRHAALLATTALTGDTPTGE